MKSNKNSQEKNNTALMIPSDELQQMRSYVLGIFSVVELQINSVILYQYFEWNNPDFVIEVLHDENFSFALRRNILEKILKRKSWYDDKIFQNFYKLSKIRNLYAHMSLPIFDRKKGKARWIHPKYPEQDVDYRKEYEKFKKNSEETINYLFDIFKKMGISDKKNNDLK